MANRRLALTTTDREGLTISQLADRTGVPPATLRSWETRYGHPRPRRLPGGHRRYGEEDVVVVQEVLRQRSSGLGVGAAIERAKAGLAEPELSVFAQLRRHHPDLAPRVLHKRTLLALTRAIEDECCARAERPVLFACFQRPIFYAASERRWSELSRTARAAVVFADFPFRPVWRGRPIRVPLPPDAPLLREWVLICDSVDQPACVAGWEHPGGDHRRRKFETIWSVEADAVRAASQVCLNLLEASFPRRTGAIAEQLGGTPPPSSSDLRRASGVLNRMVGYLEDLPTW